MPWQLTTPLPVGDLDPNGPYSQVKIVRQEHIMDPAGSDNYIQMLLQYGNTVDGEWIPGISPADKNCNPIISGSGYTALIDSAVALVTNVDPESDRYVQRYDVWVEKNYDATKRELYAWLYAQGIIDAGSVV